MTDAQRATLRKLCERYKVGFDEDHYHPQFDLPSDYVAGWIGGLDPFGNNSRTIYVGVDADGNASS